MDLELDGLLERRPSIDTEGRPPLNVPISCPLMEDKWDIVTMSLNDLTPHKPVLTSH